MKGKTRWITFPLMGLLLGSCFGGGPSSSSLDPIRRIYATWIDQEVGQKTKTITYSNDPFNLEGSFKVYAVGQEGSVELPFKTDLQDGYEVSFQGETLKELPRWKDVGFYTLSFSYKEHNAELSLKIERATFGEDIQLHMPSLTWLEPYKTPSIKNLPEDDSISASYSYARPLEDEYVPYAFDPKDINDVLKPYDGVKYSLKAVLTSPNYKTKELIQEFDVHRYHLTSDDLDIRLKRSSFGFILSKEGGSKTLKDYEPLIQEQVSIFYKGEELQGDLSIVNKDEPVTGLGRKEVELSFSPRNHDYYAFLPTSKTISIQIEKMKVHKPDVACNLPYGYLKETYHHPYLAYRDIDTKEYQIYYEGRESLIADLEYVEQRYPGTYEATVSLKHPDLCVWDDGTSEPYTKEWTIKKANVYLALLCCRIQGEDFYQGYLEETGSITLALQGNDFPQTFVVEGLYLCNPIIDPEVGAFTYDRLRGLDWYFTLDEGEDQTLIEVNPQDFRILRPLIKREVVKVTLHIENPYCEINLSSLPIKLLILPSEG